MDKNFTFPRIWFSAKWLEFGMLIYWEKKQGEPEEKTRREKAPINNKISRHEKQGRGYNPAKIVGSKCSHNSTTLVLG